MWLVLAAATVICNPPNQELTLRVLDANGGALRGAEVRKRAGGEPREALLGVTDASGSVAICAPAGTGHLGVYMLGFQPTELATRAGQVIVKLECLTGSTKEGHSRFCGDVLSRLPLRD